MDIIINIIIIGWISVVMTTIVVYCIKETKKYNSIT